MPLFLGHEDARTSIMAALTAGILASSTSTWPEETSATVSDVLMSLSTLMQLKLSRATSVSHSRSTARGTLMSVKMYTSMVAKLGSIIPAPLAMPTTRPPSTVAARILG